MGFAVTVGGTVRFKKEALWKDAASNASDTGGTVRHSKMTFKTVFGAFGDIVMHSKGGCKGLVRDTGRHWEAQNRGSIAKISKGHLA
eukprot:1157956-Pelagomonas_calceolata.AAC.9